MGEKAGLTPPPSLPSPLSKPPALGCNPTHLLAASFRDRRSWGLRFVNEWMIKTEYEYASEIRRGGSA